MQSLELLAPAKNLECGIAAIDHGADAVYIGAQRFGARAAAGNSIDDIRQLCDYAHQFGAKVYVTVNTLVYDEELPAVKQLFQQLMDIRVDAVLLQDLSLIPHTVAADGTKALTLHASTQTDNRTAEKVTMLKKLGFKRVVLARELSIDEIAQIHREVPDVELEVFVHGALCVSYSGLCYASEHCFGRSANRGECAQFCRMKFNLLDADGLLIERDRYLLSLKDLCQIDHLEQLVEAGAVSFKIEGRLKDAGYVKNVTAAYSQRLNQIIARHSDRYCRASRGTVNYTFTPNLAKTFNRGYTTYFANGRQPNIASFDTPKAIGEYVGYVKEIRGGSFNVAGTAQFANGDGLCFINEQRELEGFRVNRADRNRLFPQKMPARLRPGTRLYRNNDQEFERIMARPSAERKIPVTMSLCPTPDGFSLTMDGITVSMPCEHQQAEKPQHENIVRQLTKLGGTPYSCNDVMLPDGFSYFIPSSKLSELRRMAVEKVQEREHHSACDEHHSACNEHHSACNEHHSDSEVHAANCKKSPAFSTKTPLMQCRHCLRYALGYCVKNGGKRPTWREPLTLQLGDGQRFRLEFDCRNCQMNVYAD